MDNRSLELRIKIVAFLKIIFWLIVFTAIGLSIWYSTIVTREEKEWLDLERRFVKGWSVAQTFIACITLPLGLLKIYTSISSLYFVGYKRKRLANVIYDKKEREIMGILNSKKGKIVKYVKENKIKTNEDKMMLIAHACSSVQKLEGIVLIQVNKLFKNAIKFDKAFINQLNEIIGAFNNNIIQSKEYIEALKYLK